MDTKPRSIDDGPVPSGSGSSDRLRQVPPGTSEAGTTGRVAASTPRRRDRWLPALLGIQLVLLIVSSLWDAPTRDEANHLSAGLDIWHTGRFDDNLGNPP